MTSQPDDRRAIRSVLVAIDDASSGRGTLEAAVNLAADLEAKLQGMYFEDANLLRLAQLPFAQEITTASGTVRRIDLRSMERAMRQRADQIRHEIEDRAESARIRCSFAVARERVLQRVLLATTDTDVVFFGCRSHAPAVRPPAAMRFKADSHPLLVLLDTSPQSPRTLDTAIAVASKHARPIVVLLAAHERPTLRAWVVDVIERSAGTDVQFTIHPQPIANIRELIQSARAERPNLLLLSRASPLLDDQAVESLVNELDCATVFV